MSAKAGLLAGGKFGANLRRLRLSRGLTLRTLADEIGVSLTFLSDTERGMRPVLPVEKLRGVLDAVAATPDERSVMLMGYCPMCGARPGARPVRER